MNNMILAYAVHAEPAEAFLRWICWLIPAYALMFSLYWRFDIAGEIVEYGAVFLLGVTITLWLT